MENPISELLKSIPQEKIKELRTYVSGLSRSWLSNPTEEEQAMLRAAVANLLRIYDIQCQLEPTFLRDQKEYVTVDWLKKCGWEYDPERRKFVGAFRLFPFSTNPYVFAMRYVFCIQYGYYGSEHILSTLKGRELSRFKRKEQLRLHLIKASKGNISTVDTYEHLSIASQREGVQ